ncbi:hypothetical protein BDN67DRAFT_967883 [Paxillus ammoniavirescens]|nr:hypothetical protein BDN67DRAFT_967883 [Paxillus ammoniavirescens]
MPTLVPPSNILHSAMSASHLQAELLRFPVPESEKRMVRYLQSSSQFSWQTNTPESHLLPHPMHPNELSPVASLPVPVHLQRLTSSPHHWLDDGFGTKKDVLGSPLGEQRQLRVWSMMSISSIECNHACCLISPLTPATESRQELVADIRTWPICATSLIFSISCIPRLR